MVLKQMKTIGWLLLILTLAVGVPYGATVQAADTLALIGTTTLAAGQGSECWGWTAPDNTEYGIMGYMNGIAFFRTTPSLQLCDTVVGPMDGGGTPWREMKTYRHYCYLVSEATSSVGRQGITVIDMQYLPDSVHYIGSFTTNGDSTGFTAHTISIDTAKGYCYVERNTAQPVCVLSLANPEHPTFVNVFDTSASFDIHDMLAINDTVYVSEGNMHSWSIWDLTNKANPTMLVRVTIPSGGYVHNVWPSPDKKYAASTEETAGKTLKIWDISNLGSISLVGTFLAPAGMAHNAHWLTQDTLVVSHYQSGVVVLDVSNPALPVQIGRYDTYLAGESSAYAGCWGAFPYTKNGYIYGSNLDGRFFVLQMQSLCQALAAPALLDPANAAEDLIQPIVLTWAANGATGYRVEVDGDPAFGSPDRDTVVTDTTLSITGLPDPATFYWRVRSENACGFGNPSASRSFATGCIVAMTGDLNQSNDITAADIVLLVNYVFKGGAAPLPVAEAGDADCSGSVTSADIIRLVNYVFKAGIPPCDVCTIL